MVVSVQTQPMFTPGKAQLLFQAPYDFHRDGEFSHCGVDAFTLVRTESGWKISGGVYTVETEGCAPSPLGPPAMKE